jgi:hypothetical protein
VIVAYIFVDPIDPVFTCKYYDTVKVLPTPIVLYPDIIILSVSYLLQAKLEVVKLVP